MTTFSRLLEDIAALGYTLDVEQSRALVSFPDGTSSFVLLPADEWVQVAAVVVQGNELRDRRGRAQLSEFLLALHGRYLGCRFGYDEDHSLALMTDIYPDNATPKHIVAVMHQLDYVATAMVPLIRRALVSGKAPSDSDVDDAFAGGRGDA